MPRVPVRRFPPPPPRCASERTGHARRVLRWQLDTAIEFGRIDRERLLRVGAVGAGVQALAAVGILALAWGAR